MSIDPRRIIELSLLTTCPVACDYCPQDVLRSATRAHGVHGSLTVETLAAVLTNAASGCAGGIGVSFAGFTEPYQHPKATDLVEFCEASPAVREMVIYTTGDRITERDVIRLAEFRKLTRLTLHLDGFGAPQRHSSEAIWALLPLIVQKLPQARFTLLWDTLGSGEVLKVAQTLKQLGAELAPAWPHSRSGNIVRLTRTGHRQAPVTCDKMQQAKAPVVLPDGRCVACCNDYGLTLPLGNLREQPWEQLDFASVIRQQADPASGAICFHDCRWARAQTMETDASWSNAAVSGAARVGREGREGRSPATKSRGDQVIPLNEVLGYTISRKELGLLKLHVSSTLAVGAAHVSAGLGTLADRLTHDSALAAIETLWLTSPLVAEQPQLVEALGFTIVRANVHGLGHAGIPRQDFLQRYRAPSTEPGPAAPTLANGGQQAGLAATAPVLHTATRSGGV